MRKNFLWIIVGIVLMNGIGITIVFPLLPFLLGNYLPASQIVVGMSALASVFAACRTGDGSLFEITPPIPYNIGGVILYAKIGKEKE